MAERDWREIQKLTHNLPPPLLTSTGSGPEGDAAAGDCGAAKLIVMRWNQESGLKACWTDKLSGYDRRGLLLERTADQ